MYHRISLYLLFFLICLLVSNKEATAKKIYVGKLEEIKTIKEAINKALDNDEIIIKSGLYKEGNIIIQKKLDIIGEDETIIDGEEKNEIFTINHNDVSIKNIIFKNSGRSNIKDLASIKIYDSKNCLIENNKIYNSYFGIYFANSENCIIRNNNIEGIPKSESFSGNAIHIWKSKNMLVEKNTLYGHRDGIYFEFVENSNIKDNISTNNVRYGLHFMFSHGNSYINNTFSKNGAGVAVMYTRHIKMINNKFDDNWGPSSYGLLLKEISKSEIEGNEFKSNTVGIYMEGSSYIDLKNNDFKSNGKAMRISTSCDNNKFTYNNFIGNSFDISTNASSTSTTSNLFEMNYWDKYKGYDLNKDKIGDVPYRPVSIFSMIVERIPYSIILLRSLLVDILDISEKVMPVFIPKTIIDEKPLMSIRK